MEKLEEIIIVGLYRHGKKKTFAEILLEEGNTQIDKTKRMELASELEAKGYIQDVTYQLPFAIRARLTPSGEAFARSLGAGRTEEQSRGSVGLHSLMIFLQLNLANV